MYVVEEVCPEGLLLLLCGYPSFIVGNNYTIIQVINHEFSVYRHVLHTTASESCTLLIINVKSKITLQFYSDSFIMSNV